MRRVRLGIPFVVAGSWAEDQLSAVETWRWGQYNSFATERVSKRELCESLSTSRLT